MRLSLRQLGTETLYFWHRAVRFPPVLPTGAARTPSPPDSDCHLSSILLPINTFSFSATSSSCAPSPSTHSSSHQGPAHPTAPSFCIIQSFLGEFCCVWKCRIRWHGRGKEENWSVVWLKTSVRGDPSQSRMGEHHFCLLIASNTLLATYSASLSHAKC